MVINVGKINPIGFKSSTQLQNKDLDSYNTPKIIELQKVTPDFDVRVPQKYTNLGIKTIPNGLKVYTYKLANGHRVSIVPMEDSPTTVKNYVNVGSMNETDDIKGISHFLEHMAFNGTNGTEGYIKLERGDSFTRIDELGGWTNASTGHSITDYVNSTPMLDEKDLEQQLKVISAMAEDLSLPEKMIEKEKNPVCSEIDMILDNPATVVVDQNIRTLFNIKSSSDELIAGSVQHIKNLDRQTVLDYYNRYYIPDNMHLVITGDVDPEKTMELVAKNFHSNKKPTQPRHSEKFEPIQQTVRKDYISDKTHSAMIMLGFEGEKNCSAKEGMIGKILSRYLKSADVGLSKEFQRLNAYYDFSQERVSNNPSAAKYNCIEVECSDENSEEALKVLFDKLSSLKAPSEKTLNNIKRSMKNDQNDILEFSEYINTVIGNSSFYGDEDMLFDFDEILNSITTEDIQNYINEHLNINKTAITVMHPEVNKSDVYENHQKAQELSFQGHKKQPLNPDKISETILDNNYQAAFVETKNNNVPFDLNLYFKKPNNVNPAVFMVLDDILSRGTIDKDEFEIQQYCEDNALNVNVYSGKDYLCASGYSNMDNFSNALDLANDILKNPRITEEEVSKSVERLLDDYSRSEDNAYDIYIDYESKQNPYYSSKAELIEGLKNITVDDVRNLYEYIMKNSEGTITVNIPEKNPEFKQQALEEFSKLDSVKEPVKYAPEDYYRENKSPVVLTKARPVSQADIKQIYKYEANDSMKDHLSIVLMNSILSSSDSIGLFNSLREKEHLAYSVYSSLDRVGNCGELSLNILTSTDNKDTGIYTYENVQKSINGFNKQINQLLNSEYTDKDLENAKRKLKAALLDNETAYSKLRTIEQMQYKDKGLDYENKCYKMIDSITREDINNIAQKIFKNPPVYSIVASQDTLDYNKEFLQNLEVNAPA